MTPLLSNTNRVSSGDFKKAWISFDMWGMENNLERLFISSLWQVIWVNHWYLTLALPSPSHPDCIFTCFQIDFQAREVFLFNFYSLSLCMVHLLSNALFHNTENKRKNGFAFQFQRCLVRHVCLALGIHSPQLLCAKWQEQHLCFDMHSSQMPELC